jgi:hypothetical protein
MGIRRPSTYSYPPKFNKLEDAENYSKRLYAELLENDSRGEEITARATDKDLKELFVRPEWYGAKGDGVHDDTASIQKALDAAAGKVCLFGPGTYRVSAPLIVDVANSVILGSGGHSQTTILKPMAGSNPAYIFEVGNGNYVNRITMRGIAFDGDYSNQASGSAIHWRGNDGIVEDIDIKYFKGDGILCEGGLTDADRIYELKFDKITISYCGGDGLVLEENISDGVFRNINVRGYSTPATERIQIGFNVKGNGLTFIACHPYFCASHGMYLVSGSQNQIIGGQYESNGGSGIYADGSSENTISGGVLFYGNVAGDVIQHGGKSLKLEGCCFESQTSPALVILDDGAVWCSVSCNLFAYNPDLGIKLDGSSYNRIQGNIFRELSSPTADIYVTGASEENEIIDNSCNSNILEDGAADYNCYFGNRVFGTVILSGTHSSQFNTISGGVHTVLYPSITGVNPNNRFRFYNLTSTTGRTWDLINENNGSFYIADVSGGGGNRLVIDNEGNVGFGGNEGPAEKIDVTGNINVTGVYKVGDSQIGQADIVGIATTGSPVFASVGLTDITVGNIPLNGSGPEKVSNGGFDSDTAGWTAWFSSIASVAGGQSGNCCQLTRGSEDWQRVFQSVTGLSIGKSYVFSSYLKSGTSGNESARMTICRTSDDGDSHEVAATASGSWVQYSHTVIATATSYDFIWDKMTATPGTMLFDTFSCIMVPVLIDSPLSSDGTDVTCSGDVVATTFKVGSNQVLGAQGAAVADATNGTDVITRLNDLLAILRTHGIIDTA